MKKLTIIIIFVFWLGVSFVAGAAFMNNKNQKQLQQNPSNTLSTAGGQELANQVAGSVTLADKLSEHTSIDNCWLLIEGKIYDVTSYPSQHPGGADELIEYCGRDATEAFATKGKANPKDHSTAAHQILEQFFIGNAADIVENRQPTVNSAPEISPSVNQPESVATPASSQASVTGSPSVTLSLAEVATHNTAADCWVTYDTGVYNATNYISAHPGGANRIIPYCGQDLKAAFDAEGHSVNAQNILAGLQIGTIGESVTTQQTVPTTPASSSSRRGGDDHDDDDDEWDDD